MSEIIKYEEIEKYAQVFVKSRIFHDVKSAEQAFIKVQAGAEFGLKPIQSMNCFDIIETAGRVNLSIRSTFLAGRVKSSGRYDYRVVESSDKRCVINFFEKIDNKWQEIGGNIYTIDDAAKANLLNKDNWKKHTKTMLFKRCLKQGVDMYCPDLFFGSFYIDDEIEEIQSDVIEISEQKQEIKQVQELTQNAMQASLTAAKKNKELPPTIEDSKVKRPFPFEELVTQLNKKALILMNKKNYNNDLKLMNIALNALFEGNDNKRKGFLFEVFRKYSSKELTMAERGAVLSWLDYPDVYTPNFCFSSNVLDEASNFESYLMDEGDNEKN